MNHYTYAKIHGLAQQCNKLMKNLVKTKMNKMATYTPLEMITIYFADKKPPRSLTLRPSRVSKSADFVALSFPI